MNALSRVADRLEDGLPLKATWSALHGECDSSSEDYAEKLGAVFAALRTEAGTSQTYLPAVLRKQYGERDQLVGLLRRAAKRLADDEAAA